MSLYLIGDVQGCDAALGRLLDEFNFSPSRDQLVLLGDLVNRGPDSLKVLRRLQALGTAAQCLLGNHDLHALAVAAGARPLHKNDTLDELLAAPDAEPLLEWLRWRDLAVYREGILMVHAGVLPSWGTQLTIELATQVSTAIRQNDSRDFFEHMYGNEPAEWHQNLKGTERLRVIINALTRLRFCTVQGKMEFASKEGAGSAPEGYLPWFEIPSRATANTPMAFGHWSTLGLINRPNLIALDTGCVWGGCLSAVRVDGGRRELVQVACEQAQKPGRQA
ncbi:symmetrical bis(5'-nucleosyl)-tetraphosphatase [Variovorax sp. PCZ-1]|uniref:symmetrical bis(5'-nucleosyl)-tetraphosphatase n=1 Tax=Variovorax sp. PCZ-1 TaxID=2835533 RepID=UPI001BCDA531|nr:symmetrical bis(5'-nucleosyl)-tetraphosphatase [Variovorax sp. PCZ-1]MBS7806568.1 symmetrical bis(5'-nucleosyl)-tetraphosphatase [Variovorax sp. PCZ-1]